MRKIVSLFIIVVMLCSFSVAVSAADATGDLEFELNVDVDEAFPGDEVCVSFEIVNRNNGLMSAGYYIYYDEGVFETPDWGGSLSICNVVEPGVIKCGYGNSAALSRKTALIEAYFIVKDNPVRTKDYFFAADFVEGIIPEYSTTCSAEGKDKANADMANCSITDNTTELYVEIPEVKDFAVNAKLNADGKVVVTAENVGENVGTVYVATYNAGVLVDCEAKALADIADGWTVENLEGEAADAQIFVWNDQNVPLFDNVITVSAE